jgi:hypothetical protein
VRAVLGARGIGWIGPVGDFVAVSYAVAVSVGKPGIRAGCGSWLDADLGGVSQTISVAIRELGIRTKLGFPRISQ